MRCWLVPAPSTNSIVSGSKPPLHKQETLYSCVPACLCMAFAAFGVDVSEADLRAACDCTLAGTDSLQAVDAARSYGFQQSARSHWIFCSACGAAVLLRERATIDSTDEEDH